MRMVTLNKTLYAAFSSLLSQKYVILIPNLQGALTQLELLLDSREVSMIVVGVLTALAFALRFYKINHPDQVVFVPLAYVHLLPPVSRSPILALTKFTLGNLQPTIFYGNTTSTYTHHSQNFFLASLAGSLVLMVNSTSRTLAMATRKITFLMSECVLSPQSSVVSPSLSCMGS